MVMYQIEGAAGLIDEPLSSLIQLLQHVGYVPAWCWICTCMVLDMYLHGVVYVPAWCCICTCMVLYMYDDMYLHGVVYA